MENFVFGHLLCFFVWTIITGIEIYLLQPYQLQEGRLKKKKLQKLGLTVMISFHLILHPTVPIFHIYYSLFHLFSFVVVSVLQSFDAHGKEEKLSPGVYNLVRIKLWHQLFSTWMTLFTGEISTMWIMLILLLIYWIEIDLLDSAIQCLNFCGLMFPVILILSMCRKWFWLLIKRIICIIFHYIVF